MSHSTIHIGLLTEQISCLFNAVNDARIHRSRFSNFRPLQVDLSTSIEYRFEASVGGRSTATITVETENRKFDFVQNYNFGVLLGLQIYTQTPTNRTPVLLRDLDTRLDIDAAEKHQILIDFEYAISLATENIASQIQEHQGN